ncbi:MAG: 50S ribosomal protein L3 N(5)-glutamine methyltransferase [Halioglobus sp.]|nr:50S ribosomal protein L3 N(5)-glutamine methyltransferase [Halioglobus sp.]
MNDDESAVEQPTTVGQLLLFCSDALESSDVFFGHGTDNSWDEAVLMVLSIMNLPLDSGDSVLPQAVDADAAARLKAVLHRRITNHEPLPYLLGRAWFAGLEFLCDDRAIIPRSPIAEIILDGFRPWYNGPTPLRILDLCCGGGCIGLATAFHFPTVHVDLLDLDGDALALARENAEQLGVQDRVTFVQSDLLESLPHAQYDLVLSNPPYVDAVDLADMPAEFHSEPEYALGSGPDGLDLTRRILSSVAPYLASTGVLIVEVGNSGAALEAAYPKVAFTWVEFERGGDGVFVLSAQELQDYSAIWS